MLRQQRLMQSLIRVAAKLMTFLQTLQTLQNVFCHNSFHFNTLRSNSKVLILLAMSSFRYN